MGLAPFYLVLTLAIIGENWSKFGGLWHTFFKYFFFALQSFRSPAGKLFYSADPPGGGAFGARRLPPNSFQKQKGNVPSVYLCKNAFKPLGK